MPDEIIISETTDSAYIYKATLKVMLEQDYLKDSAVYSFKDDRLKELNEYSSQLIREIIIPKLIKEVNSSKRYASLRQVYYSLIMAQWFKTRFQGKEGKYYGLINSQNLQNLDSKEPWSKTFYFKEYQKNFQQGEYNIQQPIYTPYGQTIRSYFSGGMNIMPKMFPQGRGQEIFDNETGARINRVPRASSSIVKPNIVMGVEVKATDTIGELGEIKIKETSSPILTKEQAISQIDRFRDAIRQGKYQQGAVVNLRNLPSGVEVILVGDLHSRLDNLKKILNASNNLSKIQKGEAILVILGDAVHSERELAKMDSSVEIMQFIMDLKIQNPDNVYYMLGNHDYLSPLFSKGGVLQGIVYRNKLKELYGEDYLVAYENFIKMSPLMILGNGFIAIHGGPIKGASLGEIQSVDVADERNPIIHQAEWGRYRDSYNDRDIQGFLDNMGQPEAQLIVGHSPRRDGNWHWQILPNHHIVFAGHDRAGYAVVQNGLVNFIEVTDASPNLNLGEKKVEIEETEQKRVEKENLVLQDNKEIIVRENVDKILSGNELMNVLMGESIGGNAGPMHAAVNGMADGEGKMVIFGNIQNLPASIRGDYERGKLYGFTIRVNVGEVSNASPKFEIYIEDTTFYRAKTPEKAKEILKATIALANQMAETEENMKQKTIEEIDLKTLKKLEINYSESGPIHITLAPGTQGEVKLGVYKYGDLPARFKNLGLNPEVGYFIVEEDSEIPLESLGFKGLRDSETVDIGRNNPGRFTLNTFISRNHIRIQRRGNAIVLEDLNSTNGTIVAQDKFQGQSTDNTAISKLREPNIRVLGGQRRGGTLETLFTGDVWITAGSFAYKISVAGDIIYFQRYEKDKVSPVGRVHTMSLDYQIQIGRENGDYRLPGDQFLSGRHFIIRISGKQDNRFSLFVEDLNSLDGTIVEWNNPSSSPVLAESNTTNKLGGIDFRSLPIVTQAMSNLSANISSVAIHNLVSINLDEEWLQIEMMASSGITPSSERIKEYIQTSCAQDSITQDKDKILLCISDILRLQEERYEYTNDTLRDILIVLESMSNEQELRQIFLGKAI